MTQRAETGEALFPELERLLAADAASLKKREAGLFRELAPPGAPLVLFGGGGLGRKTLAALREAGIEPAAFSDNDVRLHGTRVEGVEVLAPAEAVRRFGVAGVFVVTVFLGSAPVMRQLAGLGCRTVLPFYPLFWRYPARLLPHYAYDLPHRVIEARQEVLAVWPLLADRESREEFLAQVRWRLDPGVCDLPDPAGGEIYFPSDLLTLDTREIFVDCGGYDGDTVRRFLARTGGRFEKIVVFEPDPRNFKKLQEALRTLPVATASRVELHQAAVGAGSGSVRLELRSSASAVSGSGEVEVRAVMLDEVPGEQPSTFIKMDIEGAELDALHGGARHIRRHRPFLAISAYHRHDDLWRIPHAIHALDVGYRFFLRRYSQEIVDDLVLYALPEGRPRPGRVGRSEA
jgi:FkbM family methyltransferase